MPLQCLNLDKIQIIDDDDVDSAQKLSAASWIFVQCGDLQIEIQSELLVCLLQCPLWMGLIVLLLLPLLMMLWAS